MEIDQQRQQETKHLRYSIGEDVEFFDGTNSVGCQAAIASANLSSHNFRHGACVMLGKRIISLGFNQSKTSPFYHKKYFGRNIITKLHSEVYTILRAKTDLKGASIFVARIVSSGTGVANSRPCATCWQVIRETGLKFVFYTTAEGTWVRERV